MKAILLVAGYATRLYPLTKDKPKALLPINGRAMLDYIIDEIKKINVIDAIIVVSNDRFAEQFDRWAEQVNCPIPITVLNDGTTDDSNKKGAIGDIHFAIESEKIDDDIVIICGDNYFTFDLQDYYNFYMEKQADCVCVKEEEDPGLLNRVAVAILDENRKVVDLEEKPKNPKSKCAVYATYFYRKDTLPLFSQYLSEGNNPDAPGHFPQWLYKIKDVYAYQMNGECYDIGTVEAYEEIRRLVGQ